MTVDLDCSFKIEKTNDVIAYFLMMSESKSLDRLKLSKMLYAVERLSLQKFHQTLIGADLLATANGPMLTAESGRMVDIVRSASDLRAFSISELKRRAVLSAAWANKTTDDLMNLSQNDLGVLAEVWEQFKDMGSIQSMLYTCENYTEWRPPVGECAPILHEDLLKALGFGANLIEEILEQISTDKAIDKVFREIALD